MSHNEPGVQGDGERVQRMLKRTYFAVPVAGETTVILEPDGPALPGGFQLATDPPVFYEISTTATVFPPIGVCIDYDETMLTGDENDLEILHYDESIPGWVEATTFVDAANDKICSIVFSLSPFVLALPEPLTAVGPTPVYFALHPNVPNPFNPSTEIRFGVAKPGPVWLTIYDQAGRMVRRLHAGQSLAAGEHRIQWRGTDAQNGRVASGVYFYELKVGEQREVRSMVLLK